jgi:ATP:ADP antiporter, AAA family
MQTWLAMAGTTSMIAHQVAAKAARDGFFLQNFAPSDLPKMVVTAALASFVLAILFSRLTDRLGPAKLIPACFAGSAMLHLAEWMLIDLAPRPVAALIYLHAVGLGAILMSGFWLLLSEVFDLREAKKRFGRIAGAGTAGGVAGGIVAERLVSWFSSEPLLLFLGFLHFACAAIAFRLRPEEGQRATPRPKQDPVSMREAFARTPLLWQLASLVFLATCTAALLDYLFKLGATMSMGKGPALVRYFAIYYTVCQALTFLLQTFLAKPAVERLGIAKSVASLPFAIGLGSTVALLIPIYPLVIGVRALEVILRGSLFRSGYEFLYTPVPSGDKRAVKTVVDVGFDRLGDAAGAGAVQLMVWLGPTLARPEILGFAMVLCTLSTWMSLRLDRSYRGVLERALVERARVEDVGSGDDNDNGQDSLVNTIFEGLPSIASMPALAAARSPVRAPAGGGLIVALPAIKDPTVERLIDLRSREARRVLQALDSSQPFDPLLVPQTIRLLAWDAVSHVSTEYLERGGTRILGQINDALSDQDLDFAIRRRLPRLLARAGVQPGVDGLVQALSDPRFEVRYQCGRALDYLKRRSEALDFRTGAIMEAAGRELSVSQAIWMSRRRMEHKVTDSYDFLDDVLRDRADRSLEHVFSLFAVVLPREPLMAAFRALHQGDRMFRGLALEYLENVIPDDVRMRLWVVLEESPPALGGADSEKAEQEKKILEALLETNARVLLQLRDKPEAEPAAQDR